MNALKTMPIWAWLEPELGVDRRRGGRDADAIEVGDRDERQRQATTTDALPTRGEGCGAVSSRPSFSRRVDFVTLWPGAWRGNR